MAIRFGLHNPQNSSEDGFWFSAPDTLVASESPSTSIGGAQAHYTPPPTPVVLPAESIAAQAAVSSSGLASSSSGGAGSVVAESSGGLTIELIFDAAAMAAPSSFRSGIEQAASLLSAAISDKITLNFNIDYSGTGGGAAAGPDDGQWESYSTVRADLINNESASDTAFNALPAGASLQGQSSVAVWNAQLKLWGLLGPNDSTTDDGSATFATDIDPSLLVGVALHELTHAMGRVPYGDQPDIFDFYRFTSPGVRLFSNNTPASPAYFSLDGTSKLADYGESSDPSDFLNLGVQGPNDPFNENYSSTTSQKLSAVDLKQLDALGFHIAAADTTNLFGTLAHTVQGAAGEIYALYEGLLGRAPDLLGYEGWMAAAEHGTSLHDIASQFLGSPEAQLHVGSPDNQTFVEELYETALDRPAESEGLQSWLNLLNSGASRADVALGVVLSAEHVTDLQPSLNEGVFAPDPDASNVARLYYGLLDRAPEDAGLAASTNALKQGSSLETVAQDFLSSIEYQDSHAGMTNAQFVDSLYLDALGRHADPSGMQGWTNALAAGMSQATIALGIAESPESQMHNLWHIEAGWQLLA
jgi:hypothetical protein